MLKIFIISLLVALAGLVVAYNYFASSPKNGGTILPEDYESRSAEAGGQPVLIGNIVLTSEFVASQFGDEEFFLQHHMDESEELNI